MNLTKEFWEKAYKENAPKMIGICRRYVQDKVIAEDLVQDAFLTAINKSGSYAGKGSFDAWLRKIAVNNALMYLRVKNLKKINDDLFRNESEYQNMDEPNANDVRSVIEQADFSGGELLEVIDNLPEHHKLVFNLYVIENYTHVQIGKELNISPGTSKSHLARARKRIQQLLYQKALTKRQEQKKKKKVALLFIIPCKSNYIDKIFKNKLQNYSIDPVNNSNHFFDSVNWNDVTLPKAKPSFFSTKFKYWIITSTTAIIIFAVIFFAKNNSGSSIAPEANSTIKDKLDTIIQPCVTTKPIPKIVVDTVKENLEKELENEGPVIIKKTIIRRKTITVRDTIQITDSSNAK